MQKFLLLLSFLFVCIISFGQTSKYMIDLEVGFLKFKNDSVHLPRPTTFSISTLGCTEIFSIGKSRLYEFGMRIEILASKLTGTEKFLVGMVYYIRKDNGWQEILKLEHRETELTPIAQRKKTDISIMGGASTDYPVFDVRLNDKYYILQ
jgi:hypothetical protein